MYSLICLRVAYLKKTVDSTSPTSNAAKVDSTGPPSEAKTDVEEFV